MIDRRAMLGLTGTAAVGSTEPCAAWAAAPTDSATSATLVRRAVSNRFIRTPHASRLASERALRIARDLHALPRCEIAVDLLAQLDQRSLERGDLIRNVHLPLTGEPLELVDLFLQLYDRFFEIQRLSG